MGVQEQIKVLVVEDDTAAKKMYAKRLPLFGYQVIDIVDNRDDAISVLEDSEEEMPDVVLMDIILDERPDSLEPDGIDIAQEINELYAIPIIYVTQVTDPKIMKRVVKTDYASYLVKLHFFNPMYMAQIQVTIYQAVLSYRQQLEKKCRHTLKLWKQILFIKDQKKQYKVRWNDIIMMKSDNTCVTIYTLSKKYVLTGKSMNSRYEQSILKKIPCLLRIHQSYVINMNHIDHLNGNTIVLNPDHQGKQWEALIGKNYRKNLLNTIAKRAVN